MFQEQGYDQQTKIRGIGHWRSEQALGAVFGVIAGNMGGVARHWRRHRIGDRGCPLRRKEPGCPECAAMHRVHEARSQSWQQTEKSRAAITVMIALGAADVGQWSSPGSSLTARSS